MACCTVSVVTEKGTVDTTFFRKSVSTFSARLTEALFKSQVELCSCVPRQNFTVNKIKDFDYINVCYCK